jgi:hypothetical protein
MDPTTIAAAVVSLVSPFLKGLLSGAKGSAEEIGNEAGGKLRELATGIWGKLKHKLEGKPAAIEAVKDVAEHPDDKDALESLRIQLTKLLKQDDDLAKDLAETMKQAQQAGIIADTVIMDGVKASAPGATAIGKVGGDFNQGSPSRPRG